MEETIQLLSFLVSFFFGFFFHILTRIHFKFTESYPTLLKYLTTFLFILNIVLLYLLILYYLNGGVLHVYFLIFVFLGFFFYGVLSRNVKFQKLLSLRIVNFFRK